MNNEELFKRILNKVCKHFGYDVAHDLEYLFLVKEQEIERLNNIIEEIQHKAYLGMKENENKTNEFQQAFTVAYRYIYNEINKLKELKEGKNSHEN